MDVSGVRQNFSLFGDIPILRHDADLVRSLHRATRYGLTRDLREIAASQRDHAVQSATILVAHQNFAPGTYNGDDSAQGYSPDSDPPHFEDHEPFEDPIRLVANPYYTHHFTTAYDPLILTDIAINISDASPSTSFTRQPQLSNTPLMKSFSLNPSPLLFTHTCASTPTSLATLSNKSKKQ